MSGFLEFADSPIRMAVGESLTYSFDTADYGGTPTVSSVTAQNLTTGKTVTSQILTGSASVSTDTITLPAIGSLIKHNLYAVDVAFTCNGQDYVRRLKVMVEY